MPRHNRHHCLWQRSEYKDSVGRACREHNGLVVPVDVGVHRELHATLQAPPKPCRDLMFGIMDNLDKQTLALPLDGLLFTIDYLENKHEQLAEHLYKQMGILALGVHYEQV